MNACGIDNVLCSNLTCSCIENKLIVFVTDATVRKMLERAGFTREEARLCDIRGCYDTSIQGAMVTGASYISLMKPLEYALHEGCDGVTGCFSGLVTLSSFDFFLRFLLGLGSVSSGSPGGM